MNANIALKPGGYTRLSDLLQPKGPLPFGRSTVWQWVKEGHFPRPHRFGKRIVAWSNDEVIAHLEQWGRL